MANIYQIIYTKVPKEQSPWNKNGFQTLFYPTQVFDRKTVLDIESRIHYPGEGFTDLKRSVFFLEVNGETHMVLLYLQPLPETVDEFGRKGMFVAHGFLLPKALWSVSPYPFAWDSFLDARRVKTFEEVFKQDGINTETGDISPLTATPDDARGAGQLPPLPDAEVRLLEVLYRIGLGQDDKLSLVIKGKTREVEELYNRLLAWLPEKLRLKAGFDPAFDGGKIFFFPLRAFGYESMLPVTGDPVRYDIESQGFSANAPEGGQLSFTRWAAVAQGASIPSIEKAFQLSGFLEGNLRDIDPDLVPPPGFGDANEDSIRHAFAREASSLLSATWAEFLSRMAAPHWQLAMLLKGIPQNEVVSGLADGIAGMENPAGIPWKTPLPKVFLSSGVPMMQAIAALTHQGKLTLQVFHQLNGDRQAALFHLLLQTDWAKEEWIWGLVTPDSRALEVIRQHPGYTERAREWVEQQVIKPWKEWKSAFGEQLLKEGNLEACLKGEIDWAGLVENYIQVNKPGYEEVVELIKIAVGEKLSGEGTQLVKGLISASVGLPEAFSGDPQYREYFVATRVLVHGNSAEDLKSGGYSPEELAFAQTLEPKGLKGLFRKLFG